MSCAVSFICAFNFIKISYVRLSRRHGFVEPYLMHADTSDRHQTLLLNLFSLIRRNRTQPLQAILRSSARR